MEINTVSTIFQQYGWPGLIAIVIITGFIIFFKYFKKSNNNTVKSIDDLGHQLASDLSKQNDKVISAIQEQNTNLIENLKETNQKLFEHMFKLKDEKHEASLYYRKGGTDVVMGYIRELRAEVDASRVSILEFHNSNTNFGGLGFVGYDMKYERQKMGIAPISSHISNRDYAQIHWIVKQVNNNELKVYRLNKEELESLWDHAPVLYDDLVNKIGASHVIYAGIYNYTKSEIIGLLCVEYHDEEKEEDLKEYELKCYKYASILSSMLSFPDEYKIGDEIGEGAHGNQ